MANGKSTTRDYVIKTHTMLKDHLVNYAEFKGETKLGMRSLDKRQDKLESEVAHQKGFFAGVSAIMGMIGSYITRIF